VVAEAPAGPLILEGKQDGREVVALGFEPTASGIDRMIAFPLLVANAVSFLGGGDLAPSLLPGRVATLPVAPGVSLVTLETPSGEQRRLPIEQGSARLDDVEMPGRYIVRETGPAAGDPRVFAVNIADDVESAIAPKERPPIAGPAASGSGAGVTPLQIWPYLVMGALALLILEWWRSGRHA
jgi:hypothetical protein